MNLVGQGAHGQFFADICDVYGGLDIEVGQFLFGFLNAPPIHVQQGGITALRPQLSGQGLADTAAAAGDDGYFSIKTLERLVESSLPVSS